MTVKLLLLRSGEDLIADIQEMVVGDEENPRVIGYFLTKPCIVKMRDPQRFGGIVGTEQKTSIEVSLYPWIPLAKEEIIPVSLDSVVTMVTPTDKLNEMYVTDVINYGKQNDQSNSTNEQPDSDQSD
jgi:hypothetical protein